MPRKKDYTNSGLIASVSTLHRQPFAIFHFKAVDGFSARTIKCDFSNFKLSEDVAVKFAASYQMRMFGKAYETVVWDWQHLNNKFFPWLTSTNDNQASLQEIVSDKILDTYYNHVNSNPEWNAETAAGFFNSIQMFFKNISKNNPVAKVTLRKNYTRRQVSQISGTKEKTIPPDKFKKIRACLMNEIKDAWSKFELGQITLASAIAKEEAGTPPALDGTLEGILYYVHTKWNGIAPSRDMAPNIYRKAVRRYFYQKRAIAMIKRFHGALDLLGYPPKGRMKITQERYGISNAIYKSFGSGKNGTFPPIPALRLIAKDAAISLEWLLEGNGDMRRKDSQDFLAWATEAKTHKIGLSTEEIGKYLYATSETICKYIAFLATETAVNTNPQLLWLRDVLRENIFMHDIYTIDVGNDAEKEELSELKWGKGRARIRQRLIFADVGKWGPVNLVKQVMKLTQPLLPHVKAEHKNLIFLCRTGNSGTTQKGPAVGKVISEMYRREMEIFSQKYDVPKKYLTHGIIRTTVLTSELKSSGGNLFQTQTLANHISDSTTIKYLRNKTAQHESDLIIGQLQNRMLSAVKEKSRNKMKQIGGISEKTTDTPNITIGIDNKVTLAGGICKDITAGFSDKKEQPTIVLNDTQKSKVCDTWWSCFGCSGAAFVPAPRFVARWIHFIKHMESQRLTVAPLKWNTLYAPKVDAARKRLAGIEDESLINAANEIAAHLPPLPSIT
jgi:hypothetical protein